MQTNSAERDTAGGAYTADTKANHFGAAAQREREGGVGSPPTVSEFTAGLVDKVLGEIAKNPTAFMSSGVRKTASGNVQGLRTDVSVAVLQSKLHLGYNAAVNLQEEVLRRLSSALSGPLFAETPSPTLPSAPSSDTLTVSLALIDGLAIGGKLREGRMVKIGAVGLEFQDGDRMTLEQWQHVMVMLSMVKNASQRWLADALTEGKRRFGAAQVQETLVQLEFSQMDVNQALGIASLAVAARRPELSSEHDWVLAKAGLTPQQQESWAGVAVQHGMSALLLQRSIAAGRVVTPGEGGGSGGRSGGIATIQGFRQIFDTWKHTVDENDPIERWDRQRKLELWEELKGPVETGLKLAKDLGIEVGSEVGA